MIFQNQFVRKQKSLYYILAMHCEAMICPNHYKHTPEIELNPIIMKLKYDLQ